MALRENIERQGKWFFKWRSYLPLLIIPFLLIALRNSGKVERAYGKTADNFWGLFSLGVSFLGFIIRCLVAGYAPRGTSGRNARTQTADVLNTSGMYSIVRHPLYVGNFFVVLGMTLFVQVWWFAAAVWLAYWIYYERIIFAEEEYLREKFGQQFLEWAKDTPTYFPNLRNWRRPGLPLALKAVLRREFSTFFLIIAVFAVLDMAADFFSEGKLEIHWLWAALFIIGAIIYITLLALKKKTKILDVPGR